MRRPSELLGRERVIAQVIEYLRARRSVLLFGPEGIGKSAIIRTVADDSLVVVDPFEHVSRQRACHLRRALDHDVLHLAASRVAQGHELGAVGRILWRFSTVRVRELPEAVIRRIVADELRRDSAIAVEAGWLQEAVALSQGRPGFAIAMARFAVEWTRTHGSLPMAAFAFAASRQDATIRMLDSTRKPMRHVAPSSSGAH